MWQMAANKTFAARSSHRSVIFSRWMRKFLKLLPQDFSHCVTQVAVVVVIVLAELAPLVLGCLWNKFILQEVENQI